MSDEALLIKGIGASPGTAVGPVRVITDLDAFARFRPGDVLVCRTTSPAWTPLLMRAGAVIMEATHRTRRVLRHGPSSRDTADAMDGDAPGSTRPSRTSAATEIGIWATMAAL